ncbi:hypothetical protein [Streptomyces sp. Ru72]|uniref:hypothetical protein n=1 Tax=Streptomyces sp. Ru72 TaxID=2080747 RepID=UPI0015E286AC
MAEPVRIRRRTDQEGQQLQGIVRQPDRGPLRIRRQFIVADSSHRNHATRTRVLQTYLRWRNQNARYRDILAAGNGRSVLASAAGGGAA